MTYLDPDHARARPRIARTFLKIVVGIAIAGFGYFALTVGGDDSGRPEIVSEPQPSTF